MSTLCICPSCEKTQPIQATHCSHCQSKLTLNGHYRLLERLGQGASGITWKALHEGQDQFVCLKELRWASLSDFEDERRFQREGNVLTQLKHPSIPSFYEYFSAGEGRSFAHYIAQEFIAGRDLEAERKYLSYSFYDWLEIAHALASSLHYLHTRLPPLVHRDLKPANVMRRSNGELMLIDFGAARLEKSAHTQVSVAGTFGYMAPEQLRGESSPASDIYALGMTLAVLISKTAPEALLDDANRPDFELIPSLPQTFCTLLTEMCALDPRKRPTARHIMMRVETLKHQLPLLLKTELAPPPDPSPAVLEDVVKAIDAKSTSFLLNYWPRIMVVAVSLALTAFAIKSSLLQGSEINTDLSPTSVSTLGSEDLDSKVVKNPFAHLSAYPKSCYQGVQSARCILDTLALGDMQSPDALEALVEICRRDQPQACSKLSDMIRWRKGLPSHPPEKLKVLVSMCERDICDACKAASNMLRLPQSVPQDIPRADSLDQLGCEKGCQDLCKPAATP